jgi:hypothetical protein
MKVLATNSGSEVPSVRGGNFPLIEAREYFVDAAEAAKFLRINPRTLMKMARDCEVPAHPLGDGPRKLWRFLLSELDEWLRGRINSARRPCSPKNRRDVR